MTLIKTVAAVPGQECQHIEMSVDEESQFLIDQETNQKSTAESDLKEKAQGALDKTDLTAIRCMKSGISFPQEWQDYVTALRLIVKDGDGDFPVQPNYPAGT